MKTQTFLRFPVTGEFTSLLQDVSRVEKVHFETPFMAYFDKDLFKDADIIRSNWSQMEMVEIYNKEICDRRMMVAALARSGQAVRTKNVGTLPFLIIIESPPMHSSGIALFNVIKEQLQTNPAVELYTGS